MFPDASYQTTPPPWLVDWMRDASHHRQCHSLVLGASEWPGLESLAEALATYLNEFDSDGGCQWRTIDTDLLRHLAGNPASRDLVLAGAPGSPLTSLAPVRPDLDRVARRLAQLGGVVLVGPTGLDATSDLRDMFRVCVSAGEPADLRSFHLWVNPERYSFRSLVSVIADSFLDWSCQGNSSPSFGVSPPLRPGRNLSPDLPG